MVFKKVDEKFNEFANDFDNLMCKIIPDYFYFQQKLVDTLPFVENRRFRVIDLGCGTGNIGKLIADKYPNAEIVCVDFSDEMLKSAADKIGNRAVYVKADFNQFEFEGRFDAVVSSLALHHLESYDDKIKFYKKMYAAMNEGSVHLNFENVLSESAEIQKINISGWRKYMQNSFSDDDIDNIWLAGYYDDDHPITLSEHGKIMRELGFVDFDVILKEYCFALLYCRKKQK